MIRSFLVQVLIRRRRVCTLWRATSVRPKHDLRARPLPPACGGKFLNLLKLLRGDDVSAALLGCLLGGSHRPHPNQPRALCGLSNTLMATAAAQSRRIGSVGEVMFVVRPR
jgi:hypothetical protein